MPLNPVPNYPSSLDSFPDPTTATYEDDDGFEIDLLLQKHNATLEILEARGGTGASTPAADTRLEGTGAGTSSWVKRAACRVFNSANISVANNSSQALTFDSERYDTDTMHSTSSNTGRMTATTAGKYRIWALITFAGNAAGIREVALRVNGTTTVGNARLAVPSALNENVLIDVDYDLAAADYIEVLAFQNSGGALNILFTSGVSPVAGMARLA